MLTPEKVEEFRAELRVMARIVHPRVVALLGAYFPSDVKKGQLKIVMELFGDDIEKLLLDKNKRSSSSNATSSAVSAESLSLFERMRWMRQVAQGMAWIHGAGIVHRDLKPSNVLYDARTRSVKVCDFGLSILLPPGNMTRIDPKGTPLYVAPELVSGGATTHACDVFSFAVLGYVFIARQRPYDNRPELPEDLAEFLGCIVDGVRPWEEGSAKFDFPPEEECPASLKQLLQVCWDGDLRYRPSFVDILEHFDFILVDCAVPYSQLGRKFWKKYYVEARDTLAEEVSWNEFKTNFWNEFATPADRDDEEVSVRCLRELFCGNSNSEVVTLENYGRVLGFLPPLRKTGWITDVVDLCRQPWFWGATDAKAAFKSLVPAKGRSFMVRFSGVPPNYTISFKEHGQNGNVLHRRVIRKFGVETVKFENGDMCEKANESFKSLPHLVEEMQKVMKWKALTGGPFWWIFHDPSKTSDPSKGGYGGYGGYVRAYDDKDLEEDDASEDSNQSKNGSKGGSAIQRPMLRKIEEADVRVLTKLRFLGRAGLITEVKGNKVQVLFHDNSRKEWVKKDALLERGFVDLN